MTNPAISPRRNEQRPPGRPLDPRRATELAVTHWERSHSNGNIPSIDDLGIANEHDHWRHRFLLKHDPIPRLAVFILCGDLARSFCLVEPIGKTLWEGVPQQLRIGHCEACGRAAAESRAIYIDGGYEPTNGGEVRYRSVFMPVRSERQFEFDYVFGAFGSKHYDA